MRREGAVPTLLIRHTHRPEESYNISYPPYDFHLRRQTYIPYRAISRYWTAWRILSRQDVCGEDLVDHHPLDISLIPY
jgi:hypothetical protein